MKRIMGAIFNNSNSFTSKITFSIFLAVISFFGANFLLTGSFFPELSIPFNYSSDTLFIFFLIKRLIGGGWYFFTDRLGFPFGSVMYDYPIPDFSSLAVFKLVGKITGSYVAAHNFYFLIGFSITAVITYLVLLKLNFNKSLSVVGALLFDFVPFHFMRIRHLFYTWYFVAPVFFYYCFRIFSDSPPFFGGISSKKTKIFDTLGLLFLSSFSVYYSFFGAMLMTVSGFASALYNKTKKNLFSALIASAVVFSGVLVCNAPNIFYRIANGKNAEAVLRFQSESEIFGLKIIQLLLPHPDHRLLLFSKIATRYYSTAPLVNENATSSLGFIGSLGFVFILIVLLLSLFIRIKDERLRICTLLTAVMVLFMTIGGFSSVFAYLITPNLRAWNRISIFIAFASIVAFLIIFDSFIRKIQKNVKIKHFYVFCSCALLAFGIWEQTFPVNKDALCKIRKDFFNDRSFIQKIESSLPENSAVFELPHMRYPESPPIQALPDYGLLIGYLHSKTLKWSYGAIKGREGDFFYQALSKEPLEKQVEIIKKIGFSGIYIDRRGYADGGLALEQELKNILQTSLLFESDNKLFAFYKLPDAQVRDFSHMKPSEIMKEVGFVADKFGVRYKADPKDGIDFKKNGLPEFVKDINGLFVREPFGLRVDSNKDKKIKIVFWDQLPEDFTLVLRAAAFGTSAGQPVKVLIGSQEKVFLPNQIISEYRMSFHNGKRSNEIIFFIPKSPAQSEPVLNGDIQKPGIGLEKLSFE